VDSYPPHLLRLPGSAPGSPARGVSGSDQPATASAAVPAATPDSGHQSRLPRLVAAPGTPGAYDPPLTPGERPRNVTQLAEQAVPATPEPWPAGTYVLVGTTGKRAHWTGTDWKGGPSPGYAETVAVRSVSEQSGGAEQ
jgi:hypothetical protein